MNLFAYGQLTRTTVQLEILGRLPAAAVAVLPGHCRRPDPTTGFFVVRPAEGAEVAGLVLLDLSDAEMAKLDAYEGVADGDYRRASASIAVLDPPWQLVAEVYVAGDDR